MNLQLTRTATRLTRRIAEPQLSKSRRRRALLPATALVCLVALLTGVGQAGASIMVAGDARGATVRVDRGGFAEIDWTASSGERRSLLVAPGGGVTYGGRLPGADVVGAGGIAADPVRACAPAHARRHALGTASLAPARPWPCRASVLALARTSNRPDSPRGLLQMGRREHPGDGELPGAADLRRALDASGRSARRARPQRLSRQLPRQQLDADDGDPDQPADGLLLALDPVVLAGLALSRRDHRAELGLDACPGRGRGDGLHPRPCTLDVLEPEPAEPAGLPVVVSVRRVTYRPSRELPRLGAAGSTLCGVWRQRSFDWREANGEQVEDQGERSRAQRDREP